MSFANSTASSRLLCKRMDRVELKRESLHGI